MTTAKERKALLAYVDWHRGRPIDGVSRLNIWHGLDLMPRMDHEPENRPAIAESLAYDGTDGP